MKILIIANSIVGAEPGVTGGESRFIELAKCWSKKGYEIHLMSGKAGKVLCEKMGLPVTLHSISNSPNIGRLEIIAVFFKMLFHLPALLFSFKEGIVYSGSEQIYDVFPGFLLKLFRPSKIRFGVVTHWLPPALFWKRKNSNFLFSLMFLISERLGLLFANLNADVLLPVSEDTLSALKTSIFNRKPAHFVLCGVNFDEINSYFPEREEKKYDAVFMKRLQRTKGILDLVEIWAETDKGLDKNIEFAGVIYDPAEKFKKMWQSKVFVLPSYEENWAIVIGEAMAAGIPVVCYDLKELRAVWEDNVIYAKTGDKKDLLDKVMYLLENEPERAKMAQKAREFVKKYSWNKIADTELSLILGINP